jgi:hypothetical protein
VFPPVHDVLLHNEGGGRFRDVSAEAGIDALRGAGLGVVHADLDGDGWQDFYVANDAYPNHLWLNRRDGTFVENALVLGTGYNVHGQPEGGMGVFAADLDNDGLDDLFVTNLSVETNTYYRNLGGGLGFADTTGEFRLGATSMALTGFGTVPLDADLDGDLDLFVVNGRVNRADPRPDSWVDEPWSFYAEPNLFYRNEGTAFQKLNGPVADLCSPVEVTRGLAVGDIDEDGDPDLLLVNAEGLARLYRNDAPRSSHWLAVRAVDPALRREAIGARVTVRAGDRTWTRQITRAYSYLSSNDGRARFGLGAMASVDEVEITWPDGLRERFDIPAVDRTVELRRGEGATP